MLYVITRLAKGRLKDFVIEELVVETKLQK